MCVCTALYLVQSFTSGWSECKACIRHCCSDLMMFYAHYTSVYMTAQDASQWRLRAQCCLIIQMQLENTVEELVANKNKIMYLLLQINHITRP